MTVHEDLFREMSWPGEAFDLSREAAEFRPLQGSAIPITQDRVERIASRVVIGEPVDVVWRGLTDPDRVGEWFGVCRGGWAQPGQEVVLDFEDGEFFLCRTQDATAPANGEPGTLRYLWRWVGVGPATAVSWRLVPVRGGTEVTVVEIAVNPPSDWRSWNGMGWPGILDQLAAHLRTGGTWRWTWRRMGPYLQIPLAAPAHEAWEALTSPGAVKHWMQRTHGSFVPDDELTLVMGDASGTVRMRVTKVVDAGQEFPSYLPHLEFTLNRPNWTEALGGRIWIEPAGLRESLLQIFHHGWESLTIPDPLAERRLLTTFWINAASRAQQLVGHNAAWQGPHAWSVSAAPSGEDGP
jgi:uncharacterized protein YndB with AHSA1/START domain